MKIVLLALCIGFVSNCFCQEIKTVELDTINSTQEIYTFVDEAAEFPGGFDSMVKFIQKNIIFPESAIKQKSLGKCYLKFVITETGIVKNVQVVRGVPNCPDCDSEAKKVIEIMPAWKPGKINGVPVNSWFQMPIYFD